MTDTKAFKEFADHYKRFAEAQQQAQMAAKAEDAEAREAVREYALAHAYNTIPEIKESLDNPLTGQQTREEFKNNQSTLDRILLHAQMHHRQLAETAFDEHKQELYAGAPRKGLAKLALEGIPPIEQSGNNTRTEKHNKSVEIQKKYLGLAKILSQQDDKKPTHEQLYALVREYVAERIEKRIQGSELFKNKDYLNLTFDLALAPYRLSEAAARAYLANRMAEHKKEFDALNPTEEEKAKYALTNIDAVAEKKKEFAMQLLFLADNASKK
ncbi:hypothetical protein HYZ97_04990 [Candidatus Pacearchaeota archaeon]|nr:hypothetical protein [Candidatus Pacearchaeota archaeon]